MPNTGAVAGASFLANLFEGYFKGKMDRRQANEAAAAAAAKADADRAALLERTNAEQAGMTHRTELTNQNRLDVLHQRPVPEPKPQAWKPTTEEEWRRAKDYEHSLKQKYAPVKADKEETTKGPDPTKTRHEVDRIVAQFQRADSNAQVNPMFGQRPTPGFRDKPNFGDGPLPPEMYRSVAEIMVETGTDDAQKASDILYSKAIADALAAKYGVDDPNAMVIDTAKLASLPGMKGRRVGFGGSGISLAQIAALYRGGWTKDEIAELVDEYFAGEQSPTDAMGLTGAVK